MEKRTVFVVDHSFASVRNVLLANVGRSHLKRHWQTQDIYRGSPSDVNLVSSRIPNISIQLLGRDKRCVGRAVGVMIWVKFHLCRAECFGKQTEVEPSLQEFNGEAVETSITEFGVDSRLHRKQSEPLKALHLVPISPGTR
jgi:hypothetical protein